MRFSRYRPPMGRRQGRRVPLRRISAARSVAVRHTAKRARGCSCPWFCPQEYGDGGCTRCIRAVPGARCWMTFFPLHLVHRIGQSVGTKRRILGHRFRKVGAIYRHTARYDQLSDSRLVTIRLADGFQHTRSARYIDAPHAVYVENPATHGSRMNARWTTAATCARHGVEA